MREDELIIAVIVGFLVLLGIFLILRELMCWYYKINERIRLQKETNRLLRKLVGETDNTGEGSLAELNGKRDRGEISQEEYLKSLKTLKQ